MRYRFPKVWCSACKTLQYPGECGHAYLVAPTVNPYAIGWARTASDRAGIKAAAVDEVVRAFVGKTLGSAGGKTS